MKNIINRVYSVSLQVKFNKEEVRYKKIIWEVLSFKEEGRSLIKVYYLVEKVQRYLNDIQELNKDVYCFYCYLLLLQRFQFFDKMKK